MGGGGGSKYDIGLTASTSSGATSGNAGNFTQSFGDVLAGGFKLPKWAATAALVGVFVVAVVWILRTK
jgi:hypothetical protein